ncbi:MAG: ATP-binding protein [Bacteroidales bacterium]|nr:ATP-binding protein [Bacteroidales bacterium]
MAYLNRVFDTQLSEYLEAFGAVLIEGPKWCGKTTTATQHAKSILKMQNNETLEANLKTIQVKPSILLKGDTPRLIDEWQLAPRLWDAIRDEVDVRNDVAQFILTGSNSVDKQQIQHSGNGRIARLKMLPMSLWESRESNGKISLQALFDNPETDIDGIQSDLTIEQLVFAACRGGWPASLARKTDQSKLLVARNYFTTVCEMDIQNVDGVNRSPALTRAILRSYARNISTLAKKSNIVADVNASAESLQVKTFDDYQQALQRLFVIQDIEAWNPAIRSKTAIRSGLKRELADPSIAVAALGLTPNSLIKDMKTFGFIFGCLCARDLKVYSAPLGTELNYYHDRYNLEADFVLHVADGRYALIECKLGSNDIEEGAEHLIELKALIQQYNQNNTQIPLREPDLLIVLTGGQYAFTREDGVKIIPIGCLKP